VCWRTVGQTTNVAEDGVTMSGYGTEYAWQIRAVGYSPVGDEVILSNAKNTSLACHVECLQPESSVHQCGENLSNAFEDIVLAMLRVQ